MNCFLQREASCSGRAGGWEADPMGLSLCFRGPGHSRWKRKSFRVSAHHGTNAYWSPYAPGRQLFCPHISCVTALAQATLGWFRD